MILTPAMPRNKRSVHVFTEHASGRRHLCTIRDRAKGFVLELNNRPWPLPAPKWVRGYPTYEWTFYPTREEAVQAVTVHLVARKMSR